MSSTALPRKPRAAAAAFLALLVLLPASSAAAGFWLRNITPTAGDPVPLDSVWVDTDTNTIKRCTAVAAGACTAWESSVAPAASVGGVPVGAIFAFLGPCPIGYTEEATLNGRMPLGTLAANLDVGTTGGADTITGVINHTHPVTDPGHAHNQQRHSATTGALTGIVTAPDTSSSTVAAMGPNTASATTGITTANPVGGVASIDNRSAFTRVIWCKKT